MSERSLDAGRLPACASIPGWCARAFLILFAFSSLICGSAWAEAPLGMVTYAMTPRAAPPLVFHDNEGIEHSVSDYRGRYVLLHLWATWCAHCAKELPSLDALQARFDPQRLIILPVSEDHDGTSVKVFYDSLKVSHLPIFLDAAGRAPAAYQIPGLPSTVLIDPSGRELARVEGATEWLSAEAEDFLRTAMKR